MATLDDFLSYVFLHWYRFKPILGNKKNVLKWHIAHQETMRWLFRLRYEYNLRILVDDEI